MNTYEKCILQSPQARAARAREKKKKIAIANAIRAVLAVAAFVVCYVVLGLAYVLMEAFVMTADPQVLGLTMMFVIAVLAIVLMIKR